MAQYVETFNTADSTTVGPVWTWQETMGDWRVVNNALSCSTAFNICRLRANQAAAGPDAEVSILVTANDSGGSIGATVRTSTDGNTFYCFELNGDGSRYYLWKMIGSSSTYMRENVAIGATYAFPYTLTVRVEGTTLSGYVNGNLIASLTDTSIAGTAGNRFPGVFGYNPNNMLRIDQVVLTELPLTGTPIQPTGVVDSSSVGEPTLSGGAFSKQLVVSDTFTPDGPMGLADTGQAWEIINGSWSIIGGYPTAGADGHRVAIDTGTSDYLYLETIIGDWSAIPGVWHELVFRYKGDTDWYMLEVQSDGYMVVKHNFNPRGTGYSLPAGLGPVKIGIEITGTSYKGYVNDVQRISGVLDGGSSFQVAPYGTKHGYRYGWNSSLGSPGPRYSNFKIYNLVSGSSTEQIAPLGIVDESAVGTPTLNRGPLAIAPPGVGTELSIGVPTAIISSPQAITPTGIVDGSAVGTPSIGAGFIIVSPNGLVDGGGVGTPSANYGVAALAPVGLVDASAIGTPVITCVITVSPTGFVDASAVGTPTLVSGKVILRPEGVDSGLSIGLVRLPFFVAWVEKVSDTVAWQETLNSVQSNVWSELK